MGGMLSLCGTCGGSGGLPFRQKLSLLEKSQLGESPLELPILLFENHHTAPSAATRAFFWSLCVRRWDELTSADSPPETTGTFEELNDFLPAGSRKYLSEWTNEVGINDLTSFFRAEGCTLIIRASNTEWRLLLYSVG
eukprot:TRINITY_DN35437_c0_g1_i1.p2 TRINITY_DN35437_c0_g1~~TRINITY_DN35437_c0_g1_i1.p2  ORF type:complete len:138 (+),score=15.69 TRINITY_DN35437_c0_g1_i1:43-456(+)